jgi:hypothetical protein
MGAKLRILAAVAAGAVVTTAGTSAVWNRTRQIAETEKTRELQQAHLASFLEDQKAADRIHELIAGPQSRDAGPYLASRLPWEGISDQESGEEPTIVIGTELERALTDEGSDWVSAYDRLPTESVDLSWMQEIGRFDYWEPFETEVIRNWHEKNPEETWINTPVPNMLILLKHSKLRLMRGIASKDAVTALREVRHLAKLVYSTETLLGAIVASRLLGYEHKAHEFMLERSLISASAWEPIDQETLESAERVAWAFTTYAGVTTLPSVWEQVASSPNSHFGFCAGFAEAFMRERSKLNLFLSPLAFGPDFEEGYASLDRTIARKSGGCRFTIARLEWPGRALRNDELGQIFEGDTTGLRSDRYVFLSFLPGYLQYIGTLCERKLAEEALSRFERQKSSSENSADLRITLESY